jgi:hypothetical protein
LPEEAGHIGDCYGDSAESYWGRKPNVLRICEMDAADVGDIDSPIDVADLFADRRPLDVDLGTKQLTGRAVPNIT